MEGKLRGRRADPGLDPRQPPLSVDLHVPSPPASFSLSSQIKGTPGYRPPSDACCSELIAWTEAGCACNADLKAQAQKENTKDLRVFAAMAKSTQILCAQKQATINDPCGAPCSGAVSA